MKVVLFVVWFLLGVVWLAMRHEARNLGVRREVSELLALAVLDVAVGFWLFAREVKW